MTQTKQIERASETPASIRKPVRVIETPVFNFEDLDDKAKDVARDWYREGALDHDWWDSTFDDAETIGLKIESFEIDRGRHATGTFTKYIGDVIRLIEENHGKDCETFKTAQSFKSDLAQAEKADDQDKIDEIEDEFLRSLLEDYSIMLQHEYEYLLSDENTDETIRINEYTFTAQGEREG